MTNSCRRISPAGWLEPPTLSRNTAHMIRIGLIGLDSTHALEFTRAFNAGIPEARSPMRVVAACAGIGTDFHLSVNRRDQITRELVQDLKIPLVNSLPELAGMVDAFMILSCDGRCHRGRDADSPGGRPPPGSRGDRPGACGRQCG